MIPPNDPDLLRNRPILDRAIVISAGVVANFIFAYLVLVLMTVSVGVGGVDLPGVRIAKLAGIDQPAAVAGLQVGDVVSAANNFVFDNGLDTLEKFQTIIADNAEQPVSLKVKRGTEILNLTVVPKGEAHKGRIGVGLDFTGKPHRRPINNIGEGLTVAAKDFERLTVLTVQGLQKLVTNFQDTAAQVAGPVAIVAMGSELVKSDAASLFDFTAIISINLAIINILPLPALDGGQLLFLLIEALRGGKPLPQKLQDNVMQSGLVLLLGLGVFMILRDSFNLLQQSGISPL